MVRRVRPPTYRLALLACKGVDEALRYRVGHPQLPPLDKAGVVNEHPVVVADLEVPFQHGLLHRALSSSKWTTPVANR